MKLDKGSHGSLVCALLLAAFLGGAAQTVGRSTVGTGLASGMQAELGAQFKLLPGESASIKDTELSLKLTGVLRSWYAKGRSHSVDVRFVSILNGNEQKHSFRLGKQSKVAVGAYQIELVAANPFGRNDCDFRVTRLR
jgi:hypothetical protein